MKEIYTAEEYLEAMRNPKAAHKFNVAPSESRKARGKVYASKAEMLFANQILTMGYTEIIEQPKIRLGEDTEYRPDFFILDLRAGKAWYVDVKGVETNEFKRIKKLWVKYGRLPLHVVKKQRGKFVTTEVIEHG